MAHIAERGASAVADRRIAGRRIVVTGAAQGLGLAIARRLADAGARLLLVDVERSVGQRAAEPEFCDRAIPFVQDLAHPDAASTVMAAARAHYGSVDGLVNCAAWSYHGAISAMTGETYDRLVAVNQRAPYFLSQQLAAQLADRDADPCIVNISSVNALVGNPYLVAYAGTKGALEAMTRALAVELAPRVRVVSVAPGSIATPAADALVANGTIDPEKHFEKYLVKRFIPAEEVAELVLFLFGPAARSVTGSTWTIDGGYTAQ